MFGKVMNINICKIERIKKNSENGRVNEMEMEMEREGMQ